jgi:hypothetical protein
VRFESEKSIAERKEQTRIARAEVLGHVRAFWRFCSYWELWALRIVGNHPMPLFSHHFSSSPSLAGVSFLQCRNPCVSCLLNALPGSICLFFFFQRYLFVFLQVSLSFKTSILGISIPRTSEDFFVFRCNNSKQAEMRTYKVSVEPGAGGSGL